MAGVLALARARVPGAVGARVLAGAWRAAGAPPVPRRRALTGGTRAEETSGAALGSVAYEAPLWRTLRRVKMLSCTSLALTATSAPVLAWMESAAEASAAGRAGLAASMAVFGALTTSMLHLFSHPYVVKLRLEPPDATGGSARANVVRLSPLGLQYTTEVDLADVEPAGDALHPLSSCRAGDSVFFVDRDYAGGRIAELFAPEETPPAPEGGDFGQETQTRPPE